MECYNIALRTTSKLPFSAFAINANLPNAIEKDIFPLTNKNALDLSIFGIFFLLHKFVTQIDMYFGIRFLVFLFLQMNIIWFVRRQLSYEYVVLVVFTGFNLCTKLNMQEYIWIRSVRQYQMCEQKINANKV